MDDYNDGEHTNVPEEPGDRTTGNEIGGEYEEEEGQIDPKREEMEAMVPSSLTEGFFVPGGLPQQIGRIVLNNLLEQTQMATTVAGRQKMIQALIRRVYEKNQE